MTEDASLSRAQKRMRLKADFKWLGTDDGYAQTFLAAEEFLKEGTDYHFTKENIAGICERSFKRQMEAYLDES